MKKNEKKWKNAKKGGVPKMTKNSRIFTLIFRVQKTQKIAPDSAPSGMFKLFSRVTTGHFSYCQPVLS